MILSDEDASYTQKAVSLDKDVYTKFHCLTTYGSARFKVNTGYQEPELVINSKTQINKSLVQHELLYEDKTSFVSS